MIFIDSDIFTFRMDFDMHIYLYLHFGDLSATRYWHARLSIHYAIHYTLIELLLSFIPRAAMPFASAFILRSPLI